MAGTNRAGIREQREKELMMFKTEKKGRTLEWLIAAVPKMIDAKFEIESPCSVVGNSGSRIALHVALRDAAVQRDPAPPGGARSTTQSTAGGRWT